MCVVTVHTRARTHAQRRTLPKINPLFLKAAVLNLSFTQIIKEKTKGRRDKLITVTLPDSWSSSGINNLCALDTTRDGVRLHAAGSVHCVSKESVPVKTEITCAFS